MLEELEILGALETMEGMDVEGGGYIRSTEGEGS